MGILDDIVEKLNLYSYEWGKEASQVQKYIDLFENGEYKSSLGIIDSLLVKYDDSETLHYDKAVCLFHLSKNDSEPILRKTILLAKKKYSYLKHCCSGVVPTFYITRSNYTIRNCMILLAELYKNRGEMWVARDYYLTAMEELSEEGGVSKVKSSIFNFGDDPEEEWYKYKISEENGVAKIKVLLFELEENYKGKWDNYLNEKYSDRKLLMPIDDHRIAGCVADGINVFRMSNIPSCIKFPVGHPVSGQLYIGHPFKPELYVPYETYEETFFVDKVHELCHLLQCLGATEITIESVKGRNVSELYNDSLSVSGDVGIKAFSGSGSYDSNYSSDRSETSNTRRAMHFTFDPMYKPYVPEGLVWYPESTEWQRLVQNRLHGNMLEYSEHLSTSQTRIINSTEQEKVKASARILWAKANVNVEKSSNNSFKESIETEWKVSVIFRSIREMNKCDEHQPDNVYDNDALDIKSLIYAAAQGNAIAQYNLGSYYFKGEGVQQDYSQAFQWFKKSAEQGDAYAQYYLGICLRDGKGVLQDYKKAFEWFEKSAEQGDAAAQYNLGLCYREGKGVLQDYKRSFEWFEKSAEQGDVKSQCSLGFCYIMDKGLPKDYKKSFEWFEKSAEQGDAVAQSMIGVFYRDGKGVHQDYKKAFEWFEKSAEQGNDISQNNLGHCYANGWGVKQDDSKAVELYRKAAEQGLSYGLNNLGYMYEHGRGVQQSYEEAFKLYSKAAEGIGNVSKTIWHLGDFYENGKGVQKDYNKALDLYKQALDKGYKEAQKDIDRVTAILNGGNTTSSATNSDNEQEYIETLKEIIADDGEITDRERRLLEKLRAKLGISESRAKELENALSNPSLTAEEQEYLDEYKSIAADGEITDKERKLLDKIRKMSGISEERAREIEKMV